MKRKQQNDVVATCARKDRKFKNLDTLKFCAEFGNKFAINKLKEMMNSQKSTIANELVGAISSKYVEYYVYYDRIREKLFNYGNKQRIVKTQAGDIMNVVFLDKVKIITHPKGYPVIVGFENGIYTKKLDAKTFALMIVDTVNNNIIMEKKSEYKAATRYRLFIVGANCHYWAKRYAVAAVKFSTKYFTDNAACISKNMVWMGPLSRFKKVKPIEDIIINDECINKITSAIDQFINDRDVYEKYGIPYRLGILLYGEPGTGKSTLIYSLALKYHRIIKYVDRSDIKQYKQGAIVITLNETMHKFFVIEEIDTLLESRGNDDIIGKEEITKFIDSMDDGAILFATTNFKERTDAIDPAILRPGRFSVQIEMGRFDKGMAIKMCTKLGLEESFADRFTYPITPAELEFEITQELYKRVREDNE